MAFEFLWILTDDLIDVHALFVLIFDNWGSEVGDLWDALCDTDRRGTGGD